MAVPLALADRRAGLYARAASLRAVRAWFDAEGLIEADVDARVASPGAEVHLAAFAATGTDGRLAFLHTSPEFAMKRLLAGGETALYYLGPVWRDEAPGPRHGSEFTMAEWYRVGADWRAVAQDTLTLIEVIARACGSDRLRHAGTEARLDGALWLSVAAAFASAGIPDLLATICPRTGAGDRDALAEHASAIGLIPQADDDWSDVFSKLLTNRVEPRLPPDRLVVLHDYPTPEAALARRSSADPRVAERFEVYACGVELANGFGELVDPVEQRARFEAAMDEKARRYGTRWPVDEGFLSALATMPEASGCALGFDRAVMLATGAPTVAAVRWSG